MTESTGTEVTRASLTDDDIVSMQVGVTSLAQLDSLFTSQGYSTADDEADGILSLSVIENKDELVGRPFQMLRWRFNASDKYGDGKQFVSIEIAFEDRDINDNRILTFAVLNDGSTGIMNQMLALTERRKASGHSDPYAGRQARGGLRKNTYPTEILNPKTGQLEPGMATTYRVVF